MVPREQPAKPVRILVVDDEPDAVHMIAAALQDQGYRVVTCATGAEALRLFQDLRPAAIILDLQLPGMDGFTVVRLIRKLPAGHDTPIVLMSTAWRQADTHRQVGLTSRSAPTVILRKPFILDDLAQCLRQLGVSPR